MKLTAELIKAILNTLPPGDVHTSLALAIERLETIQTAKEKLAADRKEEEVRHQNAVAELQRRDNAVRLECPHYLTTYYRDPSGNGNSYTECNLCGWDIDPRDEGDTSC